MVTVPWRQGAELCGLKKNEGRRTVCVCAASIYDTNRTDGNVGRNLLPHKGQRA